MCVRARQHASVCVARAQRGWREGISESPKEPMDAYERNLFCEESRSESETRSMNATSLLLYILSSAIPRLDPSSPTLHEISMLFDVPTSSPRCPLVVPSSSPRRHLVVHATLTASALLRVALGFPTRYYSLPATRYSYTLHTTGYVLRATSYGLRATGYGLRATGYGLRATGYRLQTTHSTGPRQGRARERTHSRPLGLDTNVR
jgi:hypothetical protein